MKKVLLFLFLAGCVTQEPKGECVDWHVKTFWEETCKPIYGTLLCFEEKKTAYLCKRRLPPIET